MAIEAEPGLQPQAVARALLGGLEDGAAAEEAKAAGLPGTAWKAHAFLSTFPGADPGHAIAARSIVASLTSSLSDHTLAEVLNHTLEGELGGSTWL